jgi:hypothetical protein
VNRSALHRRSLRYAAVLSGGISLVLALGATASAASAGTWGKAQEVGQSLSTSARAGITSVSCSSAGNCSAGANYTDKSGHSQAFVIDEVNGKWGTAEEVPGLAALNVGGFAQLNSLSCGSAGNCTASGVYSPKTGTAAFVVDEVNGRWGTAQEVPGLAALNTAKSAAVSSVSCSSAGNCSAGGVYDAGTVKSFTDQLFVVSEVNGTWGTAQEIPGAAALNTGGFAGLNSLSCGSAGNCSAGGWYFAKGDAQAFVVTQKDGTWGTAQEVPGTAALNTGGYAEAMSVSCTSAGNCSAGGWYRLPGASKPSRAFVVTEKDGTWGTAQEVPGIAALTTGGYAVVNSVSCSSAGNCSAGGLYNSTPTDQRAFVVSEVNGTWGTAQQVAAGLNAGGSAQISSVSCSSAGNCSAGGYASPRSPLIDAFVIGEVNGKWGTAEVVPGTAALNTGGFAEINSVSCTSAGHCGAGGFFTAKPHTELSFVDSES